MNVLFDYIINKNYADNPLKKGSNIIIFLMIFSSIVLTFSSCICSFYNVQSQVIIIQIVISIVLALIVEFITFIQRKKLKKNQDIQLESAKARINELQKALKNNPFLSITSIEGLIMFNENLKNFIEITFSSMENFKKYIEGIAKILLIPTALILFKKILEESTFPIFSFTIMLISCFSIGICFYIIFDSWKTILEIKICKYQKLQSDLELLIETTKIKNEEIFLESTKSKKKISTITKDFIQSIFNN